MDFFLLCIPKLLQSIYGLCECDAFFFQLILCNPVCLFAYTVTSWRFFNERVEDEEITLVAFFGQQYVDYQKRVGIKLPFIHGYDPKLWP